MKFSIKNISVPKDGIEGLLRHWRSDMVSGFLIFLIAMPLCLAIAKASGFPPIAGIYTAILGGIIVSFFMGARSTIKGPAAGLIAIAVGAVEELGKGDAMKGYQLTLAVVVVAAVIQILFGVFKAGKLGDFFPASAVHGMLAAIGIIIIAKQLPVLLGADAHGREPLELLAEFPHLLSTMNPEVALIGSVSLLILFLLPTSKSRILKRVPAPLVVVLVAIPMAVFFDFAHEHDYSLGHINYHIIPGNLLVQLPDSFLGGITFPDFSEVFTAVSIKYIIMFALVGSLESILSAKAIDILDPYKRRSNLNKDMTSVGIGNLAAGFIGGLPMISEIVRSSANINNGGKTRWSNFFHGVFLLVFVALASSVIEMIPNSALAAMLIYTGYRLASPMEFRKTYEIGVDQLTIFIVTIGATLATDLLIGIAAGILTQWAIHLYSGANFRTLFTAKLEIAEQNGEVQIKVKDSVMFSNYLSFKRCLENITPGKKVVFNFAEAKIIDHTLLEHLHHFEEDYHQSGGHVVMQGMGKHKANSKHPLATRIISRRSNHKMEFKLNNRQVMLRDFAEANDFAFYPMTFRSMAKYKDFPIEKGTRILYEENVLSKYTDTYKIEVSDITLTEGARMAQEDYKMTVMHVSELDITIPDFALEPERLWTRFSEITFGKDIDFTGHPQFSRKYYLRSDNEEAVRQFFTESLLEFFERYDDIHVESHRNKLLIYKDRSVLDTEEALKLITEIDLLIEILLPQPVHKK
jgi:MFS superfamily sulfate permease-like transporter